MITSLTPEQEAAIAVYRDEWLKIGLNTEPLDRDATVNSIYKFYDYFGHSKPKNIKFVEGLKSFDNVSFSTLSVGQFASYWVGYYKYFYDMFGIGKDIVPIAELTVNSGIIEFNGDDVIVCERPKLVHLENNVLHKSDGPAFAFSDGFEIYSWRGTRIPKNWIMDKDNVDPTLALTWKNAEQRRALAEIIGWDKVISRLNPRTIDEDDQEIGTLIEVDIPDPDSRETTRERFIRVLCGTSRQFALPVPPNTLTALDAQAFLHGMTPEEFVLPEVRT